MADKHDFIIIGQGIAGATLSLKLLNEGYRIRVYDTPKRNKSSNVAAGIFNPITGRNFVKTWKADLLWPSFYKFYKETERLLNTEFFHEMDQYRPFRSISEVNNFMSDSQAAFIKSVSNSPQDNDLINDPYGGVSLNQSGYLDISTFLSKTRKHLIQLDSYREEEFSYNDIQIHKDGVKFKDINSKYLIFCDGWHDSMSNLFSWLPFKPVKGEILTISTEKKINQIVNRGVFILPLFDNICLSGSTYNHNDRTDAPTVEGRLQLSEKINDLLKTGYDIVDHRAGIRPTTFDRRPFVGIHPKFKRIGILNGLGTKGVTLAPYFADELVESLKNTGEIDSEADIKRHYSLYS